MTHFSITLAPTPNPTNDLDAAIEGIKNALRHAAAVYGKYNKETACHALFINPFPEPARRMDGDHAILSFEADTALGLSDAMVAAIRLLFTAYNERVMQAIAPTHWNVIAPNETLLSALKDVETVIGRDDILIESIDPPYSLLGNWISHLERSGKIAAMEVGEILRRLARANSMLVSSLLGSVALAGDTELTNETVTTLRIVAPRAATEDIALHLDDFKSAKAPHETALGLAFVPCALANGLKPRDELFEFVVASIEAGGPADAVAAQTLRSFHMAMTAGEMERAYQSLVARLDRDPGSDGHGEAATALINLFLQRSGVPEGFREVLETQAARAEPVDEIFDWALEVFASRPVKTLDELATS